MIGQDQSGALRIGQDMARAVRIGPDRSGLVRTVLCEGSLTPRVGLPSVEMFRVSQDRSRSVG